MKRVLATLALAVTLIGCDASTIASLTEDPVISVSGDKGVKFSGAIGKLGETTSVQGTIPATFSVKFDGSESMKIVSLSLQKKDATGSMTVDIQRGGKTVKTGNTSAEYGVVSLSHSF